MKRKVLFVIAGGLILASCGGPAANTSAAQTSPSTNTTASPAPAVPSKYADCNEQNPPVGSIPIEGGGTQPIYHTKMVCGAPFKDYVDLTSMANGLDGCKNIPASTSPELGRPCGYPLRPQPSWQEPAYPKHEAWIPIEGQFLDNGKDNPPLHIRCQVLGEITRDDKGVGSNVWNVVDDPRLNSKIGYLPDTVTSPHHDGGRGWRNNPCTAAQLKP